MRMTPLTEHHPHPGELVEFRIPDRLVAKARHAPVDSTPPSLVQENHLRRRLANARAGQAQSPWLGICFDLPGRIDPSAMARALRRWILRHDTLLTYFSTGRDGTTRPAADSPADPVGEEAQLVRHRVAPDDVHVEVVPRGTWDSGSELRDFLAERFRTDTDPTAWPPFTAAAVLREDSSTLYYAVDHTHTDGYSITLVFDELRALYESELGRAPAVLADPGSYAEAVLDDRRRAAALRLDGPEVRRWAEFFLSGPLPSFPLELGVPDGENRPSTALELDLLTPDRSDAFGKVCRSHGAGFSAGLLAALGIVHHELGGRDAYRGLSVVHTRNEPGRQSAQGWFINLVPLAFPLADAHGTALPLPQLLAGAGKSYAEAGDLTLVSPLRVAELTGFSLHSDAAQVLPVVSYIDARRIPGSREWRDAHCEALVGPSPASEVLLWINRVWDRTYLLASYPDTPRARTEVPRFFHRFQQVVRGIADSA
ncbi:condensation domain-containing protein [Streptomyces sp. NPDC048002]|uniref:condensation domain-containing protein n=1 Tax=Streptomyces sp. NPDC048002 TaxID=3154344 RepID=UPI0033E7C2C7